MHTQHPHTHERTCEQPWTDLPFQPVMPKLKVPRPPMHAKALLPDLKSLSSLDAVVMPKPVSQESWHGRCAYRVAFYQLC